MAGTALGAPHPTAPLVTAILNDTSASSSFLLFGTVSGTPPTTATAFAHGCILIQTDGSAAADAVWQNTGSTASPVWTLMDTGTSFTLPTSGTDSTTTTGTSIGINFSALTTGNGLTLRQPNGVSMRVDNAGTTNIVTLDGTGARLANTGVLKVTSSAGTPNASSAFLALFDATGITTTNNPVAVMINQVGTGAAIQTQGASTTFNAVLRANGKTIWVASAANGTTGNGVLVAGAAGDLLINGGSNKPEYATTAASTTWTALV